MGQLNLYSRFGKRLFDVAVSVVGLLLLSPLLCVAAVCVRLSSAGPALFSQLRTGRFGEPFRIFKFRSMRVAPPNAGPLLTASGDSRITPIGRWLRKSKIDELPQLFNVLAGDMSFVGPRPEVPRYTELYTERQKGVLQVRPGITGPAIIVNEEELLAGSADPESLYVCSIMPAKLEVDLAYCANVSLLGDLKVICVTLFRIFYRRPSSGSPGSIQHLIPHSDLLRDQR